MIWKNRWTPETLNRYQDHTISRVLGIEITEVGADFLKGRMPVDVRTHQPTGLLHGGASVVLAETLGSIGAMMCADAGRQCVGLDINANHIRAVRSGHVTGTARPIHIGGRTQVWGIEILDDRGTMVCLSRLTMAVIALGEIAR